MNQTTPEYEVRRPTRVCIAGGRQFGMSALVAAMAANPLCAVQAVSEMPSNRVDETQALLEDVKASIGIGRPMNRAERRRRMFSR